MTERNFCTPDGVCDASTAGDFDELYLKQTLSKQKNSARKANKLIFEKSPYLLQHAYNPVDWYPWGEEAFARARNEDKPIFLSIGYSSCHYCHVMEEESFDDERVAELLQQDFISIKVDKEERPDVDAVYMAACQLFNGQGGWPLTIFMTPEGRPFFAGTYFPRESRSQAAGLLELLPTVSQMWKEERSKLLDSADMAVDQLTKNQAEEGRSRRSVSSQELVVSAKRIFEEIFDERWGGFGRQPKFPSPHNLLFLLKFYQETGNDRALYMVEKTLEQMYRGGIFDHVGYGFARYSTDEKWLAPHFEKMLYDNALMIMAYTECYQLTGKLFYREAAKQILDYVTREMAAPGGGFFSSQDADSSGVEGKYYTFTKEELTELLGEADGEMFCQKYGITENGNFEGRSIPNLIHARDAVNEDQEKLERLRKKVYDYRLGREHLHKDHKILTTSNCLMVTALCRAAAVFEDRTLEHLAENTTAFIQEHLSERDGRLYVRICDGETGNLGYLDDYAYFAWALYELYELTHRVKYLQAAMDCQKLMHEYFWDEEKGGFFLTGNNQERLIFRPKETYDGAAPSGNSAAAYVMVKLSQKLPGGQLELVKNRQLEYVKQQAANYPAGFCFSLLALMEAGEFTDSHPDQE